MIFASPRPGKSARTVAPAGTRLAPLQEPQVTNWPAFSPPAQVLPVFASHSIRSMMSPKG